MKTHLVNLLCPLAALGLALWSADAQAGVCNPTVPNACVNTFSLFGHPNSIKLTSDIKFEGPIARLRYVVELFQPEAFLTVRWAETNGNTIVEAENTFGWFNSNVSWSSEWLGMLNPPPPDVTLLTGSADFTQSIPRPADCPSVCPAKYYDWTANVPAGPSSSGNGGNRFALAAGAPIGTPVPPGFQGVTQTSSAFQSVTLSTTDPANLDAATFTDEYRFSSRAEGNPSGWRYVYTFENLSDQDVNFSLDELGFSGSAAADTMVAKKVFSEFGPGLLDATSTIRRDAFTTASGRFDALVPLRSGPEPVPEPVPEPPGAALLLAGLLSIVALGHHRRAQGWPHEVEASTKQRTWRNV